MLSVHPHIKTFKLYADQVVEKSRIYCKVDTQVHIRISVLSSCCMYSEIRWWRNIMTWHDFLWLAIPTTRIVTCVGKHQNAHFSFHASRLPAVFGKLLMRYYQSLKIHVLPAKSTHDCYQHPACIISTFSTRICTLRSFWHNLCALSVFCYIRHALLVIW